MKKRDLLDMRKLKALPEMTRIAREEREANAKVKTYKFYRAHEEGGILKVAIFLRTSILEGTQEPDYEVYIKKDEDAWITYSPREDKWYTAKIGNLDYAKDGHWWQPQEYWESAGTRRAVNEYLGTGNLATKEAVLEYQNAIKERKDWKRNQRELDEIDAVMNEVPELPKDFKEWAVKKAFLPNQYLIYRAGRKVKTGYCTNCEKEVELKERPYANKTGICPCCHQKVTYKTWDRQSTLEDKKIVSILQKLNDGTGYILRRFDVYVEYRKENGYRREARIYETDRYQTWTDFTLHKYYEYGFYKNTQNTRWCYECKHYMGYAVPYGSVIYARNLTRLLKNNPKLKYMPVKRYFDSLNYTPVDVLDRLKMMQIRPEVEMFMKMGMWNLSERILDYYRDSPYFDKKEKKPWRYLRITKEWFEVARKMDATEREIRVMQLATDMQIKLTKQQVKFFGVLPEGQPYGILRLGKPEKVMNYLKSIGVDAEERITGQVADYLDYIRDCNMLGIALDRHVLFPKNFQAEHDEVAQLRREREDRIQKMQILEKNKELKKMLPKVKQKFYMENETFITVFPKSKADFTKEGQTQHICVGTMHYFERMVEGKTVILFVRKKEDKEKPYATVEMDWGGGIEQIKMEYNHEAPKEVKEFVQEISKKIGKEERKNRNKEEQKEEIAV